VEAAELELAARRPAVVLRPLAVLPVVELVQQRQVQAPVSVPGAQVVAVAVDEAAANRCPVPTP
jgi:hypothetical protein